jgi:PhnB protein
MGRTSVYLNCHGATAEAFTFYREVFGGHFRALLRVSDLRKRGEQVPDTVGDDIIAHVELPLPGLGAILIGTDAPEVLGYPADWGASSTVNIELDSLEATRRVFDRLSASSAEVVDLREPFWGVYWGGCVDQYGVRWTFTSFAESHQHLTYDSLTPGPNPL